MPLPLLPPIGDTNLGSISPLMAVGGILLATSDGELGTIESVEDVPGILGPPPHAPGQPIFLGSIASPERVPGIMPDPLPPDPVVATIPVGLVTDHRALSVYASGNKLVQVSSVNVHPALNDTGAMTFDVQTTDAHSNIAVEDTVRAYLDRQAIFTAVVRQANKVLVAPDAEAGQKVHVEAKGYLSEWEDWRILPDFGGEDPTLIGPPEQTIRYFDWTSHNADLEARPDGSYYYAPWPFLPFTTPMIYPDGSDGPFPLPDHWPDPYSRWMWGVPSSGISPHGSCYFRVQISVPYTGLPTQFWLAAHDEAEMWLDGVKILTTSQRGNAERIDVAFTGSNRYHQIAIKGTSHGGYAGRAGVLAAVMRVDSAGMFYPVPIMDSRDNWRMVPYVTVPPRQTIGRALYLLLIEAQIRHLANANSWSYSFTDSHDTVGRPWNNVDLIEAPIGATYLDTIKQWSEFADFGCSPMHRRLDAFVKGPGSGHNHPLPFRGPTSDTDHGANLLSSTEQRMA